MSSSMSHPAIYLDYMATTPVDPRVFDKMQRFFCMGGDFGNPASSTHYYGMAAHEAVEAARLQVANLINANPDNIIWTSGATEANNLAIKGIINTNKKRGNHIVTTSIEHKTVLACCDYLMSNGVDITYVPPERNGVVDLQKLKDAMRDDTVLVSIMHANNEIGVIQDIFEIGQLCCDNDILFHVDAAQSLGKVFIDCEKLNIDLMSFSGHKIYGPKGIGALFVKAEKGVRLQPLFHGGDQEKNLRAGTLPTPLIVGFGEACEIAGVEMEEEAKRLLMMRTRLWEGLQKVANVHLNGDWDARLAGNLNFWIEGVDAENGEALLEAIKGDIAVSAGSACMSGTFKPSHVLRGIGLSDVQARYSIRMSLGRFTGDADIAKIVEVFKGCASRVVTPHPNLPPQGGKGQEVRR